MAKVLTKTEIRRNERNAKIMALYKRDSDKFGTLLELYQHIADKVGCSHITVWKVLKNSDLCK